jgi:FkbM family methyltransferase
MSRFLIYFQVLDVGANIGYYTLLGARLGRRVVSVEPMLDSIQRLHRAALIDRTADRIIVVHNALAEIRTKATLRPDGDNQGDARIELTVQSYIACDYSASVCN